MVTTHQKKWTVRDEILISDALVRELECQPPSANDAVVDRLCMTLLAVVWSMLNHAQFHPDYADTPTNASVLSEPVAEAFIAAPDAMHHIARALRKEV